MNEKEKSIIAQNMIKIDILFKILHDLSAAMLNSILLEDELSNMLSPDEFEFLWKSMRKYAEESKLEDKFFTEYNSYEEFIKETN